MTKKIQLKNIINKLKKDYGTEIDLFSDDTPGELLTLGNKAIDKMLYGGLPFGCLHEFFGLSQTGKCVTPDTYLFTKDRGFISIDDAILPQSGYNLLSKNYFHKLSEFLPGGNWWKLEENIEILGKNYFEDVNKIYFAKEQDVIRIITKTGFTIAGTPEHKLEVFDTGGSIIDKQLKDITKADKLHIKLPDVNEIKGIKKIPKLPYIDPEISINDLSITNLPFTMNRDLASLAAILLSFYEYKDGKIKRLLDKQFKLNVMSVQEVSHAYAMLINRIIGDGDFTAGYLVNEVLSEVLIPYTLNMGIHIGFPMGSRFVPYSVLQAPKDIIIQFIVDYIILNGRMEGKKFSTFSFSFHILYFIKLYLESLGIQCRGFLATTDKDSIVQFVNVLTPFNMTKLSLKFDKEDLAKLLSLVDLDDLEIRYENKMQIVLTYVANQIGKKFEYKQITQDKVYKIQYYKSDVLDIELPEQHKYIANGIVSHNSFFMQKALANAQRDYKPTIGIILDREKAYNKDRAKFLGIDTNNVILAKPSAIPTAVEAKYFILDTISAIRDKDPNMDYHIVILIDSMAAFMPPSQKGEDMGRKAKSIRAAFNELLTIDQKTMILFSNHVTYNPRIMFGNPKTKTGGTASDYLRTCGIALDAKKPIVKDGKKVGAYLEVIIDKTRKGPGFLRTIVPFYFATGIPELGGYDRYLVYEGILQVSNKLEFKKIDSTKFNYIYIDPVTKKEYEFKPGNDKTLQLLCNKFNL